MYVSARPVTPFGSMLESVSMVIQGKIQNFKTYIRKAAKKSSFPSGRATKRGGQGGLNGCANKENRFFFNVRKTVTMSIKPRGKGGGLKALVAGPLSKELFFAASLKAKLFKFLLWRF